MHNELEWMNIQKAYNIKYIFKQDIVESISKGLIIALFEAKL